MAPGGMSCTAHVTDHSGTFQTHPGLSGKEMKPWKVLGRNRVLAAESSGGECRADGRVADLVH